MAYDNTYLAQQRPHDHFVAVLRDREHADALISELGTQGLDTDHVLVLHGPEGLLAFDYTGADHGWWAHLRRSLKNVGGADANILFLYNEALIRGRALCLVPLFNEDDRRDTISTLRGSGASAISYFTRWTMESIPLVDHE